MHDFTIDMNVLMSGSGHGAVEHERDSRHFMKVMEGCEVALVVIDDGGFINHQYDRLRDYGQWWFRRMTDLDKVVRVRRASIDRETRTRLSEAHFDREDYRYYVRTAAASANKRLVTHDRDYSARVRRILSERLGVRVTDAGSALAQCM
jgi:hypothetical protein